MKTVIVYASVHHGNTKKLVEKIAEECKVDLIDAVQQPKADLSDYDRIGFASGIYFSKFHQTILKFASENLPENKKVFMICTYGGNAAYKSLEVILKEKKTDIIGKFGCKGYDTFGPFKLQQSKGSLQGFDLVFHGSFSGLEHLFSLPIAGRAFHNPPEELLDILDLKTGAFEALNHADSLQFIVAEVTDIALSHQIREESFLVIIS